jgi:hypothetical protein
VDRDAYNRDMVSARAEVTRRAVEQYVFALAKGWSEAGRRLWRKHAMDEHRRLTHEIRDVKLEGEYPDTAIKVLVYSDYRGSENWHSYALWQIPLDYYVKDTPGGKQIVRPETLAGDILMWATGG